MSKIKITYACFLNSSGYSNAAQNYIKAIDRTNLFDIKIRIFGDKPTRPAISDMDYEYFIKMVKKPDDFDSILIYHCIPTIQKRIKGYKKTVGFFTYETYSPPDNWVSILNKNDAIIVPSKFNYKILAHEKIEKPLYYLPHCLDMDVYNRDVLPLYEYNKYTFLFMGIFRERKGYKELIEAFLKEFSSEDNVQLVIKTDRIERAREYVEKMKRQIGINKGFSSILFENKVFDEKQMPKYLKSVNCFVSATKGEGFGLPGLQCMALGIPVIITNFSGCQDYANNRTATLLEPNGFVFRRNMDNIPQFRDKKWAFIEVRKIQKAMRYIFNNQKKVEMKSNWAFSDITNKFNYKVIGNTFINIIREIYG